MSRVSALAAIVIACVSSIVSAQEGRVDTLLVLKTGQEVRGQFVGFRNGLFTLRLPDGRIAIHGVGEVDRMQPSTEPASIPAPARPPAAAFAVPALDTPAAPAASRTTPAAAAALPTTPAAAAAASATPAAPAAPVPTPAPAPAATLAGAELEARACGPEGVRILTQTTKTQHPTPAPPADKAIVYIVRPSTAANRIQTRLAVNGSWVGANYANNYFFLTLDPGEHYFCSQAEDRSVLSLNVQPGRSYYLQQSVTAGMMKSRSSLDIVTDQEGRNAVVNANLSVKREPK